MFAPGFEPLDRAWARLAGYERRYWHPSVRNWGTEAAPAPTCCLVPGDGVDGIAFAVDEPTIRAIDRREAMTPIVVTVEIAGREVPALTWPMRASWRGTGAGELAERATRNREAGGGPSGDAIDYVTGVAGALAAGPGTDAVTGRYLEALGARGTFP